MASFQNCYACTGITLKAKDGSTVVARTIEWAASDNDCRWVVVPRGHIWKSLIPGGGTGRSFTNEYGYVGVSVVQDELMMEGMNEKASPPASSISLTTESTRSIQKRIMRPTYLIFSWSPTFSGAAPPSMRLRPKLQGCISMDSIHVPRPYIGDSPSRQADRSCWRLSTGSAFSMKTN